MPRFFATLLLFSAVLLAADATYDGAKVHYESYGTGKEAIVFIHGWTCDLTFWRGQAPVYEKHRALLIDLPGHGRSDKPEVAYTQERFARAIDAVMRDAGVESAILVGHSMGGPVIFTFLRLFSAKTKALVMVDAYLPAPPKDDAAKAANEQRMKLLVASLRQPTYQQVIKGMIESMFSAKTTAEQREEIRTKMSATPQHVLASAMEGMLDIQAPKAGETYKVPAIAIMAMNPARASFLEAQLRATFPNLRKYEGWEGSGHFLMMESPDRFNKAMEDFLKGL